MDDDNDDLNICVASLQKGPHVAKIKIKILLILIQQVMTNLLKKKLAF